jgi:hypothetical protein
VLDPTHRLVVAVVILVWLVLAAFLLGFVVVVWRLSTREPNRGRDLDDSLYPNVGEPFQGEWQTHRRPPSD